MLNKYRRNERVAAVLATLSSSPNKVYSLSFFGKQFQVAKSTVSEDIDMLREIVAQHGIGSVETVTGAAGGVRYQPFMCGNAAYTYIQTLCAELSGPQRVLPGGFLYLSDILSHPDIVKHMGAILAGLFQWKTPDFILTMETKGIPVALMTAAALGIPLVTARRTSKAYEGAAVNINYVSASTGSIETMSLSRRAVKEGQRVLIVDDFLKGGGTAKGMIDLMGEFSAEVVGLAFVMETVSPAKKYISDAKSLMTLRMTDDEVPIAVVEPASWLHTYGLEG